MRLSKNELKFLRAMRDCDFSTVAQVAQHCGFQRSMAYHYYRSLHLAGLIDGFEVTYAGHKALEGEPLQSSDDWSYVDIRLPEVHDERADLQ